MLKKGNYKERTDVIYLFYTHLGELNSVNEGKIKLWSFSLLHVFCNGNSFTLTWYVCYVRILTISEWLKYHKKHADKYVYEVSKILNPSL